MVAKQRRQAKVAELVTRHRVWSQQELAGLLGRDGISVTQATLSRDLTELGVVKGPQGYLLPDAPLAGEDPGERLARTLRGELVGLDVGGTLVVLRTRTGHGNALAVEIDRARAAGSLEGSLGTIAGDDTVFLAARSTAAAGRIAGRFRSLAGIR
jgi:transcriptional regulator of arginine metabolism